MSNSNPKPPKRRFGYELKRAQQALRNRMDAELRPLGLTTAQYAVLCAVEKEPGISNANLAKVAFVTAQTMHGILINMEKGGLITRVNDPAHGKILKSQLAAKGRRELLFAHKIVARIEAVLINTIGKNDIDRFADLLSKCAEVLGTDV